MALDWGLLNTHAATDIADAYTAAKAKQAQKGALAMYATDPQGAYKSALASGDLSTVQAVTSLRSNDAQAAAQQVAQARAQHDQQIKDAQDRLQATAQFASGLKAIPDPAARKAYALQHADVLAPHGVTTDNLNNFDYSDQGINAYVQQATSLHDQFEQSKPLDLGPGHVAFDPHSGAKIAAVPQEVKGYAIPRDGSLALVGGNGDVSMTPGAGGAPSAGGVAPVASSGSRGARNNNPLNLTNLASGQWAGQTGSDGRFAQFASTEAGFAAADKNLAGYGANHGIDTVQGVINRWAPASDHNDPSSYAATVARDLGITPTTKINLADPALRQQMLQSMSKVELGGTPAVAQGGGSGVRIIQGNPKEPKAQYRPATAAENIANGRAPTDHAQISPDGKYEPLAADPNAEPPALGDPSKTGASYLATLPAQQRNIVKLMVAGRTPPPSGVALSKPQTQALIAAAAQYDPSFDETSWKGRVTAQQDWASTRPNTAGGNRVALNTAISHMGKLLDDIDALGNVDGFPGATLVNRAKNALSDTYKPAVNNFNVDKKSVAGELVRSFRGAGGTESDIQEWQKTIDDSRTPSQLRGALQHGVGLLYGRLAALKTAHEQALGPNAPPVQVLSPDAAATIKRIMGRTTPQARPANPKPSAVKTQGDGWKIVGVE